MAGKRKIGAGHLGAMGRLGLRELRAAAYTDSNVAQSPEYGLYGTATPGEVSESRRDDGLDQEPQNGDSVLASRMHQVRDYAEQERTDPEIEMEMEP